MGLFKKSSPAEKTLKDLMGGFLLNSEFMRVLELWGLKSEDGYKIQRNIKDDIKNQGLTSDEVPIRIHYYLRSFAGLDADATPRTGNYSSTTRCNNCGNFYAYDLSFCPFCHQESGEYNVIKLKNPNSNTDDKKCPNCGQLQDPDNLFCINCGYSFSKFKTCPSCNQSQEPHNRFCINCGYDFENKSKNPSVEMRKFRFLANQEHNLMSCPNCGKDILKGAKYCHACGSEIDSIAQASAEPADDDISELEALYSKSVSEKYSPYFKFAYVIYLNSFGGRFLKSTEREYRIAENDLNTQAIKDAFITQASPLVAAQKSTVADLKEVLKAHDLKVSGKKDELIQRLGDNLSAEELEELFPEKPYELSQEGRDFINENDYILFYEDNNDLKRAFSPDEFERIFQGNAYSSKEEMCSLIIDKLESIEKMDIFDVRSLIILYEATNDQLKLLDNYFRLFLVSINSNGYYSNQEEMDSLYSLLHSLSLDIDDLKSRFHDVYSNFNMMDLKISEKDSFTFILKIFSGESIYKIEEEINQKFFSFD